MVSHDVPDYRLRHSPRQRMDMLPAHGGIHIPRADCSVLTVGIIDTGAPVHRDIPLGTQWRLASLVDGSGVFDEDGHGTAVAGVMCGTPSSGIGGLCHESCFHFAKCTSADGSGDISGMVGSMLWCLGVGCDVVVCSVSAFEREHLASAVVKKMVDKGVVLVCAVPPSSGTAFPSEEPGVIRVKTGALNAPTLESGDGNCLVMPDYTYDVFSRGDRFTDITGSSFANAFVAGCVVNAMAAGAPRDAKGIIQYLLNNNGG